MFNPYLLDIRAIGPTDQPRFRSYLVSSTAPVNVEQPPLPCEGGDPHLMLREMADFIKAHAAAGEVEVLVQIHGYNTDAQYIAQVYAETAEDLAKDFPPTDAARLFICYRWSSEPFSKVLKESIKVAQSALPKLLQLISRSSKLGSLISVIGLVFGLLLVISEGIQFSILLYLFLILLFIAILISVPVLTLLVLRLSNYFRDVHRADQYGALDLLEFIRQLNQAVMGSDKKQPWEHSRIRLSFIGYSMGASVVTQTVRILSDVFDRQSISTLDMGVRSTPPPSEVGDVFVLGRLVLVAPDISIESVISGRGNTLRSSLRRFQEAYLFCNEGDMALRVASTVANYFSFPAGTREGGYRLGAMTVRKPNYQSEKTLQYGVLNLLPQGKLASRKEFLDFLSIRRDFSLRRRQDAMWGHQQDLAQSNTSKRRERKPIAELFTYFDCTDYQEELPDPKTGQMRPQGVLGLAAGKASLGYLDLIKLTIAMARGKLDPHGGYLKSQAKFTRQWIFGLACIGFGGMLDRLQEHPEFSACYAQVQQQFAHSQPSQQQRLACLQVFSKLNEARGIQVLLSPERYNVDVFDSRTNRKGY